MLSDRERETLCEIQRQLCDEDPKLAQALEGAEWPVARDYRRYAYMALMIASALLSLFTLALGLPAGALLFALAAGWSWVVLQRRNGPGIHRP